MSELEFELEGKRYLAEFIQDLDELEILILRVVDEKLKTESLQKLSRIIHSMKGTSGSFGFELLSIACHKLEDQIQSAEYIDADEFLDRLLATRDLLLQIAKAYIGGDQLFLKRIKSELGFVEEKALDSKNGFIGTQGGVPAAPQSQRKIRVLVGETSKILIHTLTRILSNYDIEISYSRDGHEILGRLIKERFDFLISSLYLPTIDAVSMLKSFEFMPVANPNLQTILVTSSVGQAIKLNLPKTVVVEKDANLEKELSKVLDLVLPKKVISDDKILTKPLKILLVDDSNEIHLIARIALKKYPQVEMISCNDPHAVARLIIENQPGVVLFDVQMPGKNGDVLVKELAQAKLLDGRKTAFLTATHSPEEIERLKKLGVNAVMMKPFSPKSLVDFIVSL